MEFDDLEKQVRAALHAEAETGPDYATILHARIMARVAEANHAAPTTPRQPAARRRQMMMMAAMVIGIALLAFIVLHIVR